MRGADRQRLAARRARVSRVRLASLLATRAKDGQVGGHGAEPGDGRHGGGQARISQAEHWPGFSGEADSGGR
jgi:hypothetical protein